MIGIGWAFLEEQFSFPLMARNVDGFNNRLLRLLLGDSDSQHAVLHGSLHLIHLRVLRQPEPSEETAAAPLHAVPHIGCLFLLLVPLPADLQDPPFLHLHLHFLLLHSRQVRLEHVRLRGLLPVDGGAGERRHFGGPELVWALMFRFKLCRTLGFDMILLSYGASKEEPKKNGKACFPIFKNKLSIDGSIDKLKSKGGDTVDVDDLVVRPEGRRYDHPGHLLVPIKLNGTNYPSWSKSMIHALTAKNKIGFINGSIEQPSEKDQPTEYALWNQCNNMILSWLTHSVEPDLAKGVIHAKTAYQVWEDFKDQFSQKNAPAIYQIQKSLASFSQGTMTVSTYFTKLKGLWDELDTY
ncbi:hypothetical protein RJ639_035104 [Escallonia herrerae]|uniref:Retrotransposon Copia-like N-terminal domain-containing protein n=1 Tax=Escallonia herrerae TaxID=1293975 RepID=A0AA88WU57_9ASTE|nr:hypothetical protein RJ639_035104 [Escallonia herrerae]